MGARPRWGQPCEPRPRHVPAATPLFTGFQHHIVALPVGNADIKHDTASAANDHRWTRQTSKSQGGIFVKLFSKALACAAFALSTASAHATVTYSFSGFFGE